MNTTVDSDRLPLMLQEAFFEANKNEGAAALGAEMSSMTAFIPSRFVISARKVPFSQ